MAAALSVSATTRRQFLMGLPGPAIEATTNRLMPLGVRIGRGPPPFDEFLRLSAERRRIEELLENSTEVTPNDQINALGRQLGEIEDKMLTVPATSIDGVCARLDVLAEEFDRYYNPDDSTSVSTGPQLFTAIFAQAAMYVRKLG